MKTSILFASAFACFVAMADGPVLSGVSVRQDYDTRSVVIAYTLSGGPAYVTLDGIAVSGEDLDFSAFRDDVHGAVNAKLPSGSHKAVWRPDRHAWEGHVLAASELSVRLSVWAADTPPDYAVVNLCVSNSVSYYSSTNALPGGIAGDAYRDDKLLLRRIPAKNVVWRMGSPADEVGRNSELAPNEIPHYVKLTSDYWMGVFKITAAQFYRINGGWLDYTGFSNVVDFAKTPANYISYNVARGSFNEGINWPTTGHNVTEGCFLGKLRRTTGVMFDLPTDAQWEYACRAGTGEAYCFFGGTNMLNASGNLDRAGLKQCCWFYSNTTNATFVSIAGGTPYTVRAPMPVGLMPPNNWGLYDIVGNDIEWVLDAFSSGNAYLETFGTDYTPSSIVVDPKGPVPTQSVSRVRRGCLPTTDFTDAKSTLRCASRLSDTPGNRTYWHSLRVVCPLEALP